MRTFRLVMIAAGVACASSAMAGDIAPGGTLRAAYLGTNPAQAMRDPATGEVRGAAYDGFSGAKADVIVARGTRAS